MKNPQELELQDENPWEIESLNWRNRKTNVIHKNHLHRLRYNGKIQLTGRGETFLNRIKRMAGHLNKNNMAPCRKIECAADAPNPEK